MVREPLFSTAKGTASRCIPISSWDFVTYVGLRRSLFIAALPVTLSAWAAETGDWLLAGREGKCVPLSALTKRGPEFQGIKSHEQLVEKMRAAGHKVEIKQHKAGSRTAVEVRIPSRDLYGEGIRTELGRVLSWGDNEVSKHDVAFAQ